jgi:Leucine-rich repeat (LRR) protein
MKKALLLVGCLSLLLVGILSVSCNKEGPDSPEAGKLNETMSFTFTGGAITFEATAQQIVVDWGDGATNEYVNVGVDYPISHRYQNNAEYTVQIQAAGLSRFDCYGQRLTALYVSGCPELKSLYCSWNQLTELDVSRNTKLTALRCDNNPLPALDVSYNTKLTYLKCDRNQFTVAALNALFTSLPPVQRGDLYIRDNPGAAGCNYDIASNKGWFFY